VLRWGVYVRAECGGKCGAVNEELASEAKGLLRAPQRHVSNGGVTGVEWA